MKLDKLLKRLKRDLAASPQKAGALGLMILVALYFWAPLVMKATKGKAKPGAVAVSQVILADDPVLAKAAPHAATDSTRWDRVRLALANDQLLTPAAHHVSWTNPFSRLREQAKPDESETAAESAAMAATQQPKTITPEPALNKEQLAGVMVSSILIGKREAAAVISGTVYRVGDKLILGAENAKSAIELLIVSIDELGVDLKHQDKSYRIERSRPKLSPGDHVRQE
ncbi:hypothetical protein NA78x_003711 [Anatilimnocola sp. NA78]|uniref:hypothetical protein n=1 Tax=Anatilimnocola sp. NA78 TaxID=3415683 RepID=UPI003CE4578C